jgi:signal peptidase I
MQERSSLPGKIVRLIVGRDKKLQAHGDPAREVFETIVFVVILVLMLKLFVAEAFVIPTGSMASTLWGDQITPTCPECGETFPVTASQQNGVRMKPASCLCQNCGFRFTPSSDQWNSGDRVLVSKFAYHLQEPKRFDVPVFKYPVEPYSKKELSAMNYIKRLIGLPGETIAIYKGDIYKTTSLTYPTMPRPQDPLELWSSGHDVYEREIGYDYRYTNTPEALDHFQKGGFEMVRKTPKEILAVRRLVFDLDKQPKSLKGAHRVRWQPVSGNSGWEMAESGFNHKSPETGWVHYQHVEPGWGSTSGREPRQPAYIKDFLSYNVNASEPYQGQYWVPDLMVECEAKLGEGAEVTLELVKAATRYQAVFSAGKCQLFTATGSGDTPPTLLAEKAVSVSVGKNHHLQLANFDARMTVWVDGRAIDFGTASDYESPNRDSFRETPLDEKEPARIGAKGEVSCRKVSLWRDVYYTCSSQNANADSCGLQTYYVHPDHYLCLGDNSASSSDGRTWGLVPKRLMLGRAIVVYWPWTRWGIIE